jgi:hypothetical protein
MPDLWWQGTSPTFSSRWPRLLMGTDSLSRSLSGYHRPVHTHTHTQQAQQLTPHSFPWLQTSPAMTSCCPMCDSLVARSL